MEQLRPPNEKEIAAFEKDRLRPPTLIHSPFTKGRLDFKTVEYYANRKDNLIFVEVHIPQKQGPKTKYEVHFSQEEFEKKIKEKDHLSHNPVILAVRGMEKIDSRLRKIIMNILAKKFEQAQKHEKIRINSEELEKIQRISENLRIHQYTS